VPNNSEELVPFNSEIYSKGLKRRAGEGETPIKKRIFFDRDFALTSDDSISGELLQLDLAA
jgi:hypothetical protein